MMAQKKIKPITQKLNLRNMKKNQMICTLIQDDFDRIVFCQKNEHNEIIGLNYHQGIDKILWEFATPCPALTDIYNRLDDKGLYSTEEEVINMSIELYNQAFLWQKEYRQIPLEQRKLIQKALDFYVEQSNKFNSVPTDTEAYELFDMTQLSNLMQYGVYLGLSEEDKGNFTRRHKDLPSYVA